MGIGVFGLKSVYKRQLQNIEDEITANIPTSFNYGYFFAGAFAGLSGTEIFRLDFSTETTGTSTKNALNPTYAMVSVSNNLYGYLSNGISACRITRLDFTTETVTAPGNNLSTHRFGSGSSFSAASNYGWYVGGWNPTVPSYYCTIDRIDLSTETVSLPGKTPGQLTQARSYLGSISSNSFGYFGGGYITGLTRVCTLERLDFSAETISTPAISPGQLTQARAGVASIPTLFYGYFAGGSNLNAGLCTIDRLDFTTETSSNPGKTLTITRERPGGVSNNAYGYFAGGSNGASPVVYYCTIDRLELNTETVAVTSGPLPKTQTQTASIVQEPGIKTITIKPFGNFSESGAYGYFAGGSGFSTIDRIDFFTQIGSRLTSYLNQEKTNLIGVSNSYYGYFAGGLTPSTIRVCTIERLDFSTETISIPNRYLSLGRGSLAAVSNNFYGYFGGGWNISTRICTIERLDFLTETISLPTKNLTQARTSLIGSSNSYYGYFAGGLTPTPARICTIERLDFSTEIVSALSTILSDGKTDIGSTSNNYYGYFGGGQNPTPAVVSTIDRLDFSTETLSVPISKLSKARSNLTGTSSNTYGYFAGGVDPGSVCTIDRLDFSIETVAIPGINLTQARSDLTAVSGGQSTKTISNTKTRGYIIGGYDGSAPATNNISRMDLSTESISNPSSKLLVLRRYIQNSGISNRNYGYIGGGWNPSTPTPIFYSMISRIDFSNDVSTDLTSTLVQGNVEREASFSSNYYGYFAGGRSPDVSTICRIDFSSETTSRANGNLPASQNSLLACTSRQSSNYGFFGGGYNISTLSRYDVVSDTAVTLPQVLPSNRRDHTAAESPSYGYFAGGLFPPTVALCSIDRLDFSSNTASKSSNLPEALAGMCFFSGNSYGYFAGGGTATPTLICTIRRIDFSTETITAPGKNLSTTRIEAADTSV